jgi:hypothetical protein
MIFGAEFGAAPKCETKENTNARQRKMFFMIMALG